MAKYIFTCEQDDGTTISVKFEKDGLMNVLENFEYFLKGSGFVFDGYVDIVEMEKVVVESEESFYQARPFENVLTEIPVQTDVVFSDMETLKCPVCFISWETMKGHSCYDKNCPRDKSDAN